MYADVKTYNFDASSRISPDEVLNAMSIIALNNRCFIKSRNYSK